MFDKLRNRFLLTNLIIISFIMFIAFGTIYTITYQNVHRDIEMELHRILDMNRKPGGNADMKRLGGDKRPQDEPQPQDRSVSFTLQTDNQWNITSSSSAYQMDSSFYKLAIQQAAAKGTDEGQFNQDDNRWAYAVQKSPTGYTIVYLEVSAQQTIITNLIYTFIAVGLAMIIVIYFTSRFFANRSIAPIKEAFYKQKQFIADASHELKTPLAVIQTNADVLLSFSDDTIRNQVKWLHHIKSETERMKTLTGDLLYLTEMDDARTGMIYTNFDLSEAVESVMLTMEAVIYEKELSFQYEVDSNITAHGNSEQMKQVVMILLDNAIKYTNARGSIILSLKKRHNDVLLEVTNTGEGIPPEHLEHIFDRFYRIDASRSRQRGSHGLGLAIAKSIVEQHKGKIYAKSALQESTSFYVQLPYGSVK